MQHTIYRINTTRLQKHKNQLIKQQKTQQNKAL